MLNILKNPTLSPSQKTRFKEIEFEHPGEALYLKRPDPSFFNQLTSFLGFASDAYKIFKVPKGFFSKEIILRFGLVLDHGGSKYLEAFNNVQLLPRTSAQPKKFWPATKIFG